MADEIHVDDIGTVLEITMLDKGAPLDISTADTKILTLKKAVTGELVQRNPAPFTTDGTDGKMEFITVAGDLDQEGLYELQAQIGFPSGTLHKSDVDQFVVHPNIF